VRSRATPRFWAAYRDLPPEIRELARKAYRLFRDNARHPSLQFKKVHARDPIYSVRVTLGYRAIGLLEDEEITWFWIGTHAEYDRLLERL
jgi:mRNA-degrading endonuclease RelE of RelBE toxin-antitoxin system